jgi:hypothetical protein
MTAHRSVEYFYRDLGANVVTETLPINHTWPEPAPNKNDGDCKHYRNKYEECKSDPYCMKEGTDFKSWDISTELKILCSHDTTRKILTHLYGHINDPI